MGSATASVYASGSGKYVNANMYWDSNSESTVEVTVEVSSNGSWRLVQRGNSSKVYLSHSYATDSYSNTFTATDGGEYIFQVYCTVEEQYYNDSFSTSGFTVDSSDDSGGDDSGGGSSGDAAYTLHIEDNGVTAITVTRTWSNVGSTGVLSDGAVVYYPNDRFTITAEPKDGYEIDYYDNEEPFYTENLTRYKSSSGYKYQPTSNGDIYVTATATPIATARIYDASSGWIRYTPYIYDANSGWERYVPYVYSGTGWDRYS